MATKTKLLVADDHRLFMEGLRFILKEELQIEPKTIFENQKIPFFVTVAETVGLTAGHIDVSLWYIFEGNSSLPINDKSNEFKKEFDGYYWFRFEEVLNIPINKLDPNMHRFVTKLKYYLGKL